MATQSLYRRYRPRRFAELKGQDHVVRALRDAVASGREGQAYLFSGPRGTGKTTSARILAKALNCEQLTDGEPCCECDSCVAVERGTSYDVHELDAASNRGIDAMRDLIEKASLGTAGRHKVYILDEVHMLTKEAEATLLKTLEEPPPHVVFVLATTDPQKMAATIRSRTQHLEFHLLPTDVLAEHVAWVADDAGYDLPQAALDAALIRGGGSARDTLSALELIASTGGEVDEAVDVGEFLVALSERDPGMALTAMAHAVSLGRDPRTVTEEVVRHLRNAFLSLMAPELVVLPREQVDALAAQAQQLGAARLVRAIERLGGTLTDLRHAPDPRLLIEVALVQLTHDDAASDVDGLANRLTRLEQTVKDLASAGPSAAPVATDPSTGRAVLGGAARRPAATRPEAGRRDSDRARPDTARPDTAPAGTARSETAASDATGQHDRPAAPSPTRPAAGGSTPASSATGHGDQTGAIGRPDTGSGAGAGSAGSVSVPEAWERTVRPAIKPLARALYSAGAFVGEVDGRWRFEVPNATHAAKCDEHRPAIESALSAAVGRPVTIELVAAGGDGPAASSPASPSAPAAPSAAPVRGASDDRAASPTTPEPSAPKVSAVERAAAAAAAAPDDDEPVVAIDDLPDDDEVDLTDLRDAPPETAKTGLDRLAEAFPGSELMADE